MADLRDEDHAGPDISGAAIRAFISSRSRAEILCAIGLFVDLVLSYVLLFASPSLLLHHDVFLEAAYGSITSIVSGGVLARVHRASLTLVIIAPLVSVVLYDVFQWWAGRLWGEQILWFYSRNNLRLRRGIKRAERFVRKRGVIALALEYYLPIPNIFVRVMCGLSGMSLWLFLVGDVISTLLWEALLISLGWAIGHPAIHVIDEINHYSLWVTIGLIVVVMVVSGFRNGRGQRDRRGHSEADTNTETDTETETETEVMT